MKMKYADVLAVLADPTRIRIIELLAQRNYCVGVIGRILGISAPAVSQHMKILQAAGLVRGEKIGYHTHYSLNRELLRGLSAELTGLAETTPWICERQGMRCGEGGMQHCLKGCGPSGRKQEPAEHTGGRK